MFPAVMSLCLRPAHKQSTHLPVIQWLFLHRLLPGHNIK